MREIDELRFFNTSESYCSQYQLQLRDKDVRLLLCDKCAMNTIRTPISNRSTVLDIILNTWTATKLIKDLSNIQG